MADELLLLGGGMVIGCMLTAMMLLVWKMLIPALWPIRVPLIMQRGQDGFQWDLDERARKRKNKDGTEALELQNRRDMIREPAYAYVTTDKKGRAVYPLFSPITGQYTRVKIVNNITGKGLEFVEDKAAKNWAFDMLRRAELKYADTEGFFQKYGMYVMTGIFAAMVIFFVIYYGGKMEQVGNSLAGAADSLAQGMKAWSSGPPPANAPVVP